MPSRKRGRKSRKHANDSKPSFSKNLASKAATVPDVDLQGPAEKSTSAGDLDTDLGQLTLKVNSDVTQALATGSGAGWRGHDCRNTVAQDAAKAHYGDVYNIHQSPANVLDESNGFALMKALAFDGMNDRLAGIRPAHAETCSWMPNLPKYLRWRDPDHRHSHHGALWIKGRAGTGKSTVMAHVLEHDQEQHPDEHVVSFFFNARSPDALAKSTEGMYRSLLHQIVNRFRRLQQKLSHVQAPAIERYTWPVVQLENIFRKVVLGLSTDEKVTCFVDALDECKLDDVRQAVGCFEDLVEAATLKNVQFLVCFSSRHYPHITMRSYEEILLDVQPEHMKDIREYTDSKLLVPEVSKIEISNEILRRCSGIFLWVVLVVKSLREKHDAGRTPSQLRATLNSIPDELQELFADILKEPDKALMSILQWMLFSKFELEVGEIYCAVQISIGVTGVSYSDFGDIDYDGMRRYILHASRGLISIRDRGGEHHVLFIHESVSEFFLSGGLTRIDPTLPDKNYATSHAEIAVGCLRYLELAFDRIHHPGAEALTYSERQHVGKQFPLLDYALTCVLRHIECSYVAGTADLTLLARFPLREAAFLGGIDKNLRLEHSSALLYGVVEHGCYLLAKALLAQTSDLSSQGPGYPDTFHGFISREHKLGTPCNRIQLLKPDLRSMCGGLYDSPLHLAAGCSPVDFVESLLDHGADINLHVPIWGRPIHMATVNDRLEMVNLLLDRGAYFDTQGTTGLLHNAAKHAGREIIQRLLREGIDVNAKDCSSTTALHYVPERTDCQVYGRKPRANDLSIAQILLEAGANLEAVDGCGASVLLIAAGRWKANLVQFLLERGANVHARDKRCYTALHRAVDRGSYRRSALANDLVRTFQALLGAGADVNAKDGGGSTALIIACETFDYEVVELLLDNGADIDAASENGNTALIVSCAVGHAEAVESLLRHGASCMQRSEKYGSAEEAALAQGHEEVARLVSKASRDVDKR